jgi:hypothetical protein
MVRERDGVGKGGPGEPSRRDVVGTRAQERRLRAGRGAGVTATGASGRVVARKSTMALPRSSGWQVGQKNASCP